MATELAAAYVTLIPSLKGAQSTISSQLSGMDFSSAGSAMGKSLSKGLGSSLGDVSKKLSGIGGKTSGIFNAIAKPAVGAISAIGTSLVGLAAHGGLARALSLEQAQSMFSGLKLDWETYRSTVQEAVDGTIYTLGEAANVTANLAASGITDINQTKVALNGAIGIADTFGASLEDIGSIYQKVAAQGKLTGDHIFQLTTKGVNATSILANYLGKTGEDITAMVRKGEVDFQTFADAMYDAFGDAAQGANETFTGSMANMRNALNRIGEDFMTPFKDGAIPVFNAARVAINGLRSALTPLSEQFAGFADIASGRLVEGIDAFAQSIKLATDQFDEFGNIDAEALSLTDLMNALAAGFDAVFGAGTSDKIAQVASAIALVGIAGAGLQAAGTGAGFMDSLVKGMDDIGSRASAAGTAVKEGFGKRVESVKTSLAGMHNPLNEFANAYKSTLIQMDSTPIKDKIGGAFSVLQKQLPNVSWALGEVGSATGKALTPLKLAGAGVAKVGSAFAGFASTVGKGAVVAAGALGGVGVELLGLGVAAAMGNADLQAMADGLLANMDALSQNIGPVAEQAVSVITTALPQITAAIPGLVGAFVSALTTIAEAIPQILPELVAALTTVVNELAPQLVTLAPLLLSAGMQLFIGLVQALAQTVPVLIAQIPALISGLLSTLLANLPSMIAAGLQLFLGVAVGLLQAAPQIIATLVAFIPQLVQILVSMAPLMLQAGIILFQSIGQSLSQVAPLIGQALLDLVTHLPEIIISGVTGMLSAGAQLFGGLIDGLTGKAPEVGTTVSQVGTDASSIFAANVDGTQAGSVLSSTFTSGLDTSLVDTSVLELANGAVDSAASGVDASPLGEAFSEQVAASIDTQAFSDQAAAMVEAGIGSAGQVDATGVGKSFSDQAAAGIDAETFAAAAQALVSSVTEISGDVHIGVDADTSGAVALQDAASEVAAAFAATASSIAASMSEASSAAAAAGASIRSSLNIPDKTVRVNVSPGYVSLPHFSISGSFDLKSMSVPTVGVSWYAKGGIFTQPSVIGVGEGREPEGVFPLSWLSDNLGGNTYNITLDYKAGDDANEIVRGIARALRTSSLMEA